MKSIGLSRILRTGWVFIVVAGLLTLYATALHPWMMSWGTTDEERQMVLPGDERPADSGIYYNRAINVNAPASVVWQWLVQHGQDQAGFYSNTYLENLVGADIHNATEIKPEWQHRAIGDKVPMSRPDILGGSVGEALFFKIKDLEPSRMLVTADGNNNPARWFLMPLGDNATRILLRERSFGPVMGEAFAFWVWDPMHFVMEQRMLQGIKERAEGQPLVAWWIAMAARIGWIGAGLAVAGLFLSRRRWMPFGLLCAALVIPSLSSTGDFDAALAGFLAIGISLLGMLSFGRRWVMTYPLVAAGVLLTLLLAPDSWTAFGLIFDCVLAAIAVYTLNGRSNHRGLVQSGILANRA